MRITIIKNDILSAIRDIDLYLSYGGAYMELIQTINCGNDFSLLDSQLLKIMDSNISGIRLNLNKYNQNSEVDSLSRLIEIISKYKQRYKFLYDLPFPYNKTRILEYKITGDVINLYCLF